MVKLKEKHYAAIVAGAIILIVDIILLFDFETFAPKTWYFQPIVIMAFVAGAAPFLKDLLDENKRQKEIETEFLEFVRNLVESVRSGVSIPQAIVHASKADYGALNYYVKKLAHHIEWGYPLHHALKIFADGTKNPVIKRSIEIVTQAEKSGGDMAAVLEAVTTSVLEIQKIKDERKATSFNQTIQGYIIFFIFVAIMVVMQVYLLPQLKGIGADISKGMGGQMSFIGGSSCSVGADIGGAFSGIIIVQGIFAGLMIGKFSEGNFKFGIKHSVIMVIVGYLLLTMIMGILGGGGEPQAEAAAAMLFMFKDVWFTKHLNMGKSGVR